MLQEKSERCHIKAKKYMNKQENTDVIKDEFQFVCNINPLISQ